MIDRVALIVFSVAAILVAASLRAATFTVTNNFDSGAGSLRQALLDANSTAGTDTIVFAITGAGVHTIAPTSALPTITEAVIIDGYTQTGATANTLTVGDDAVLEIELTGTGVSNGTGLSFSGTVDGAQVRGLVLNHWNNAIILSGSHNCLIDGNFFGTNVTGTAVAANNNSLFVLSSAQGNTLGGATSATRNIISGSTTSGISMGNSNTSGNTIQNNYIGTNAAGTAAIPNTVGISLNSPDHDTVRGNLISGNTGQTFSAGINIGNTANHITVVGNLIGVASNGTTPLANVYGITLSDGFSGGANDNTIGSMSEPNVIAFNTKAGVALQATTGKQSHDNAILYNSIHDNGMLGIDLGDDGVTPNDGGDGDVGLFNDLQNFPQLTSAQFGAGAITVQGSINSKPTTSYQLQFFRSTSCDSSGNGEGETFLGETTVSTDAGGIGAFTVAFTSIAGGVVTATATDPLGNTSEFSPCQAVTTPAQPQISIDDPSIVEGNAGTTNLLFTVSLSAASASTVTVDYATADQTATAGSDYVATSGTVTLAPGEIAKTVSVTINGDVTAEGDETLLLNLSNPSNATISDAQGVGTIRNDDGLSSLAISDVTQAEGNAGTSSFDFTVTLSPASVFPVTIGYATADGTASSSNDYQGTSGTLTFAPGQTTKTISVLVNGDNTNEPDETFVVDLFNPGNASLSDDQATGTITNDDPVPTVTVDDPSKVEGNSGTSTLNFTFTLSNPSSQQIQIPFSLADGTATVGSDYQTNSGSIVFFAGQTTRTLGIGIIGDTTVEPDETFFVNLSPAANVIIGDSQGMATIINDDGLTQPGITINDTSVTEGNAGTVNASFTVSLSTTSVQTVTVNYATANGTATAGSDYVATSGTLTFTPGQTSQTISVVVNGDTTVEPDETFFVNLTAPVNATIFDNQAQGTISNDDVAVGADLAITKTGPSSALPNGAVVYSIHVTNNGPSSATGVTVTDPLPSGSSFVSATSSQGSCSGTPTVVCLLGTLANAGTATITLTLTAPSSGSTMTNTASVSANESDPTPTNSSATAVTVLAGGPSVPTLSIEALLLLCALLGAAAVIKMK